MNKTKRILTVIVLMLIYISALCFGAAALSVNTEDTAQAADNFTFNFKNELTGAVPAGEDTKFTFRLSSDKDAPLPSATEISVDGSADCEFGSIKYTKPGVYIYKLTPVQGKNRHIEYDLTVYEVSVLVINKNGNPDNGMIAYIAAVKEISSSEKLAGDIVFKNKYYVSVSDNPQTPQTGDISKMELWIFIMLLAITMFAIMVKYGKKNDKLSE